MKGHAHPSSARYVLHIDGKHKLHHGKWLLVSIGTHDLCLDMQKKKTITHSYRPILYQFVQQQETRESVRMLCETLDELALLRFGARLKPGTVNMDHSSGFRQGVLDVWPDTGGYHLISHTNKAISHIS